MADRVKPFEEMEKPELVALIAVKTAEGNILRDEMLKVSEQRETMLRDMHAKTAEIADLHVQLGRVVFESVKLRKPKRWAVYARGSV